MDPLSYLIGYKQGEANGSGGSGGSNRIDLMGPLEYSVQGGSAPNATIRQNRLCLTKDASYGGSYSFITKIPSTASKLCVTIESTANSSSYDKWLTLAKRAEYIKTTNGQKPGDASTFFYFATTGWNLEQLKAQNNIISFNPTTNVNFNFQTVEIDISNESDFYLYLMSMNETMYLYDVWAE